MKNHLRYNICIDIINIDVQLRVIHYNCQHKLLIDRIGYDPFSDNIYNGLRFV